MESNHPNREALDLQSNLLPLQNNLPKQVGIFNNFHLFAVRLIIAVTNLKSLKIYLILGAKRSIFLSFITPLKFLNAASLVIPVTVLFSNVA